MCVRRARRDSSALSSRSSGLPVGRAMTRNRASKDQSGADDRDREQLHGVPADAQRQSRPDDGHDCCMREQAG